LSRELLTGLIRSFKLIENNQTYKVVILTGYDNYFCSGGTRDDLLGIQDKKMQFTDSNSESGNIYSIPLDCRIPVISAMQGHAIGGGFALGLFADFVIFSRESIYTTNFMKYGFTPGMGATYVFPKKLGIGLAEELLLNAGSYRGEELKNRGIPFPVLPRAEVMEYAYDLARQIAEKPRTSLITLKDHLVKSMRDELPGIIERELTMHATTFHQPEVKELILKLYGK
jgi:polyketide biosynthesis enoyl-CoA hydratase PksI